MTTLPNMGLEQPTVGSDRGTWGAKVNANSAKIDAHTHIAGQGNQIPTAGININADLSFGSLYGPKDLHAITFASIVALSSNTYNKSLFVSDGSGGLTSGELYWRNVSGTHVKLTSGNALNVAAFVGGIGGDYSAVGAIEAFDNSGSRYTFKDSSNRWQRLASGDVRLFEFGSTDSVFVGLAAPAALGGSYTLTMPLVLPAVSGLLQVNSSGVISTTPTLPASKSTLTISSTGTLGTITTTTINVPVALSKPGSSSQPGLDAPSGIPTPVGATLVYGAGSGSAWIAQGVPVGARVTAVRMKQLDVAGAASVMRFVVKEMSALTAPTWVQKGGTFTSLGNGSIQLYSITGINYTVLAFTELAISFTTAVGGTYITYIIELDYDLGP